MYRDTRPLLAAPLILFLAGCHHGYATVTVREPDPPPRVVVVDDRSPAPVFDIVTDEEEDDVSYVVYREYYDCTEEEISFIPYYRRYYIVDDCDLYFLFHVARHTRQPIDAVIRTYYYDCGRDYDRLIVSYRIDRSIFFVDLPRSYNPDGPYDRPYRHYRERSIDRAHFTNTEFRALVSLKIAVDYQGERPENVIARVRENPSTPQRAIHRSRETLGRGGRNVRGRAISEQAPRPWTMPEAQSRNVRQDRQQKAVRSEKAFGKEHVQRVDETRNGGGKPDQRTKDAERQRAADEAKAEERRKELERQKRLEREKELERQKKAPKNPKEPRKPKESGKPK